MNNISKILVVSFVAMLLTLSASAQDEEGAIPRLWKRFIAKKAPAQTQQSKPVVPERKKPAVAPIESMPTLTRKEMIQQIKDEVSANEGVLEQIKELKKGKDKDGKEFYAYSNGKEEVNIEELDADRLEELLGKVNIQVSAYQAAQQMEIVMEAQRVSAIQQQMPHTPGPQAPRPPPPPPQPPRRY